MTSKKQPKTYVDVEENSPIKNIAAAILNQPDRMNVLLGILDQLPPQLVEWFAGEVKSHDYIKNHAEIEVADTLFSGIYYPGDIIIKNNGEPKVGSIVRIAMRSSDGGYYIDYVRIKKINIKKGNLEFENLFDKEGSGIMGPLNIVHILDRVIRFGTPEWDTLVEIFNLQINKNELISSIEDDIEYLNKTEFHDKEENLEKLKKRAKEARTLL
jgi:hypothetical protein